MTVLTFEDRFWAKVRKTPTCWLWTASTRRGYGQVQQRSAGKRRSLVAHRVAYELLVGPIPDGLQLDHLCRDKRCVRPDHLEPVSCRENLLRAPTLQAVNARKTHCQHGHPFDAENTYRRADGSRSCRACHRRWDGERRLRAA